MMVGFGYVLIRGSKNKKFICMDGDTGDVYLAVSTKRLASFLNINTIISGHCICIYHMNLVFLLPVQNNNKPQGKLNLPG